MKRERQRDSIDGDDDSAKKSKIESNSSSRQCLTHFEKLSNETIFEIFELLDFDDLCKAFSKLNIRFENLLADPHCRIRLSLSLVSKSTFQRYYTNIIEPNQHRIKSLYLPNTFMINPILTSLCNALKLLRLENLCVHNIFSKYLDKLFQCLSTLPVLSKLTITPIDYVEDKAKLYCQILGLSRLKYCKIILRGCHISKALSIPSNTSSSIKHLVIRDNLHINTLMALLSYIPYLRYLSVHCLCGPYDKKIESCSMTFNQLTYIDLYMKNIVFDDFVLLMRKLSPRLDTLLLLTHNDKGYLDGEKWQEFISLNLPYLRIFDLYVSYFRPRTFYEFENVSEWKSLFRPFQSSFYVDRKWFFTCQYHAIFGQSCICFYSTNPYRRKQYCLYKKNEENFSSTYQTTHFNSVENVATIDEEVLLHCSKYFPNAIELEISSLNSRFPQWNKLNNILPLQKLTRVIFSDSRRYLANLTGLLSLTPNLQALTIVSPDGLDVREKYVLFGANQTFQLVSNTNHIKNLILSIHLTLEEIKLFTDLCPQVEHLTISIEPNLLRRVLQCLLSKDNTKTRHLNSLFIECKSQIRNGLMEFIIKSGDFQVDYIIGNDEDEHLRYICLWL